MRLLRDYDRVVRGHDSVAIDLVLLDALEALEAEHGAPEDEGDD